MDNKYYYAKKIRSVDKGVKNIFDNLVVIDEMGNSKTVPCVWATEEKIEDEMVINRSVLPIIGVCAGHIHMVNGKPVLGYVVRVYSMYQEDINQILEQVILKFDNTKNCKLYSIDRNHKNVGDRLHNLNILKSLIQLSVEGMDKPVETQS